MVETINSVLPIIFVIAVYLMAVLADNKAERQDQRHRKETKELVEMMLAASERRDVYMLAKNIADVEDKDGNKVNDDVLRQMTNFYQVNKIKASQIGV